MNDLIWQYDGIDVHYSADLDGDGTSMAQSFVDYIRANHAASIPFENAFEWCAGPGFIGFALLATGICRNLVLGEINPKAVAAALETISGNSLTDRVRIAQGDNLSGVLAGERFDLVVSNPPNFFCLNPRHPSYARLRNDLRPNDPGWDLHRRFYAEIPRFLRPGALLCIEEVDPFADKCFMPNAGKDVALFGPEPFDLRPRPPIDDFVDMIELAGLNYRGTVCLAHAELPVHFVISAHEPEAPSVRLRDRVSVSERLGDPVNGQYRLYGMKEGRELGTIDLGHDSLWVMEMLERLVARRGVPQTSASLAVEMNLRPDLVRQALDGLSSLGWVHAPKGCA